MANEKRLIDANALKKRFEEIADDLIPVGDGAIEAFMNGIVERRSE